MVTFGRLPTDSGEGEHNRTLAFVLGETGLVSFNTGEQPLSIWDASVGMVTTDTRGGGLRIAVYGCLYEYYGTAKAFFSAFLFFCAWNQNGGKRTEAHESRIAFLPFPNVGTVHGRNARRVCFGSLSRMSDRVQV